VGGARNEEGRVVVLCLFCLFCLFPLFGELVPDCGGVGECGGAGGCMVGGAVVSSVLRFDCWLSVRQEVKGTVFSACFVVCVCPWFVGEVCVVERVSMWLGGMQR
jgi:hypothetical protein